jgi:hypothetical protein
MVIRLIAETKNGTKLTKHYVCYEAHPVVVREKNSGNLDVVHHNLLWLAANCFVPNAGKVRAKNGIGIVNVFISYKAVFKKKHMMYNLLEVALRRSRNHAHKAASAFSILDLLFGKAFVVGTNSIHVEMLIRWRVIGLGWRRSII